MRALGLLERGGYRAGLRREGRTRRWIVDAGVVFRDCVRDWRIRSKGFDVGATGMWLIRASGGRVIFFVRSKVCVKGVSVGEDAPDAEAEGEPRSGKAALTVSTYLVTSGQTYAASYALHITHLFLPLVQASHISTQSSFSLRPRQAC